MSAAWTSDYSGSQVARHEWKGLSKFPGRLSLEDHVSKAELEQNERERKPRRSQRIPGAFDEED